MEKFYALFNNYSFTYKVIGEDGKPCFMTNHVTGQTLRDKSGQPIYATADDKFVSSRRKMSQGYLSTYEIDETDKDPQNQEKLRVLRNLADPKISRNSKVMTEDAYEQHDNKGRWLEKQKRIATEKELGEYKAKAARADELERRIAEMESRKHSKG